MRGQRIRLPARHRHRPQQVPNTNQVNFPFLFNTTDPAFATIANGGHVTSSTGNDIIFQCRFQGLTQLDYELENTTRSPDRSSRGFAFRCSHIRQTRYSTSLRKRQYYASQQNPTGVWTATTWRLARCQQCGQRSLVDSTSNGNNATNNGATATAGQIDGGMQPTAAHMRPSERRPVWQIWFKAMQPSLLDQSSDGTGTIMGKTTPMTLRDGSLTCTTMNYPFITSQATTSFIVRHRRTTASGPM